MRRLAGAALLVALGGGLGYWVHNHTLHSSEDGARARALLDEASAIVEKSTRENLVALAAESFAAASNELLRGEEECRQHHAGAAGTAQAALDHVRAAREEALAKVNVARAATLTAIRNTVLHRAAQGIEWSNAELKMNLFDRDRIATKDRSEALIDFQAGNRMRVEENSVMVVERLTENQVNPSLSMTLKVEQGSVRSAVARQDQRDVRLEINLPRASVVIDTAKTEGGKAEIGTRVHSDLSNRVAVYTGEAEVVAPSGEKVLVHQNQYAEVSAEGKLSAPRELPTSAITILPGRDATVYTSAQRPEITFKWKTSGDCTGFHIEVARDQEFAEQVVNEKVTRPSFTFGNFKPGRYYWRLSCVDGKGTEGQYAEVSTFAVVVDNEAPKLRVLGPLANASTSEAVVEARCQTEAGVSVFINGQEASPLGGGQFVRQVALSLGLNTLVFEAVDAAGNVIYNSLLVTRRPRG